MNQWICLFLIVVLVNNCFTAASTQMENAGYMQAGRGSAIDTKSDNLPADPIAGAISTMTDLKNGKPVMVGVEQSNEKGYIAYEKRNANESTSHFIVIRSSSVDAVGNVSFNYLDNGTRLGKNKNNNLQLNKTTGIMSGRMENRGVNYKVSEVRKSWKKRK